MFNHGELELKFLKKTKNSPLKTSKVENTAFKKFASESKVNIYYHSKSCHIQICTLN